MTESQKFIQNSTHLLESAPDYFNLDCALMRPERYKSARVRMLLILPTPAITKSVSATVNVINDLFFSKLEDCYLDIAYLPTKDDLKVFDNSLMPYAIGHQTHLDPSHFDIVGFSISVLHEILTIPAIIKSFERCDRPIPLTWTERKDLALSEVPLMIAGGITAAQSDLCFGELGDGRQAYLDALVLGQDDTLVPLINWYSETPKETKIQEFIDRCFESPHFYQPQAYRVVYKDNLIVENTKINPKAQDWVYPMYEKHLEKRLYVARTIVQGTGSNAGDTQVQLSEGAVVKGTKVLTNRGLLSIEEIGTDFQEVTGLKAITPEGEFDILEHHSLGVQETVKVKTKSGHILELTPNHPVFQWNIFSGEYFKRADELKPGDFLVIPLNSKDSGESYTKETARAMGKSVALSKDNSLPSQVWLFNKEAIKQFLVGYLETNGKIFGTSVRLFASSWSLLHDIKVLASRAGINGNLRVDTPNSSVERAWILKIRKEDLGLLREIVDIEEWDSVKSLTDFVPVDHKEWSDFIKDKTWVEKLNITEFGRRKNMPRSTAEKYGLSVPKDLYFDEVIRIDPSTNEVYDLTVDSAERYIADNVLVHNCTGGKGSCNFCSEGNYSGAWVENSIENIRWAARESKKYCAADGCKPLSFNVNHYSDFRELLYELKAQYPKVSFINMRMEELAKDIESWHMMSYLGASRLSAPIEGLSDRIRNGLMNKNLSKESVDFIFDQMIGQPITDLKVGLVWMGVENDDDWEEYYELIDRVKAKAAEMGKLLPARLKATPLVHYPGTAFFYTERISSRISYRGERYINDERFQKNREHNVMLKFNGFIGSTFIEQALVDLGRSLTPWVHKYLIEPGEVCYNTRPIVKDEIYPSFKALITSPEKYFAERPIDATISPIHRIRLSLEGGILSQARKIQENKEDAAPTGKCLFTYEGCKTSCYKSGMSQHPYVYYADVKIVESEKGLHMIGTNPITIKGCDYCETPDEMVHNHVKRPIKKKYSLDDIKAAVFVRDPQKYRFVLNRSKNADRLNPNNTAYTAIAALLNHSDDLLDLYWKIDSHSFARQSSAELPWASYGIQIVDVVFKEKVDEFLPEAIERANKWLRASHINSFSRIPLQEKVKPDDLNLFKFETTLPLELFQVSGKSYRGNIRVLKNALIEDAVDKTLLPPQAFSRGKTQGYFVLPVKYNPFLYLQSVLKEKRITVKNLLETTELQSLLFVRESHAVCNCGKPAIVSLLNQKTLKCKECTMRALSIMDLKK